MEIIDLSGEWHYKKDEEDRGMVEKFYLGAIEEGNFILPGSTCENQIGTKKQYATAYSREIMRCPVEKYEYIAPLWLKKEIEVPESFENMDVSLYLERVNIASCLWVDGKQVGREIIELSAPHIYRFPEGIQRGRHTLVLRIDNRDLVGMEDMASGYSVDTQGIWNGIIGKIELRAEPKIRPQQLQIYPQTDGIKIRLTTVTDNREPMKERNAKVVLCVRTPQGEWLSKREERLSLWTSRQNDLFQYKMDHIEWWDEFHPALYELKAELYVEQKDLDSEEMINRKEKEETAGIQKKPEEKEDCSGENENGKDDVTQKIYQKAGECTQRFGMKNIKRDGRHFRLNGRRIALRGTIDCAQFPLTGYPPVDRESWMERMRLIKKYGFNHLRFHAWCPPEAAFEAADETGIYLSIEMPMWLNHDVTQTELGENPAHADYYRKEIFAIMDAYGNHPSFLLFSNGNENMGDFSLMEQLTVTAKAYDPRHLYTTTSNFDHPVMECEDYFNAFQARGHRIRLQTNQDKVASENRLDYKEATDAVEVPVVSFEVGQYCVYPDVDIIEDYKGNILPVNFEMVRQLMKEKDVYDRRKDFVEASGSLAFQLYKEDVEANMRTSDMAGFQLLSFSDYTGQSLATIGLLDVFFREKEIAQLKEWTDFCSEVVPLFSSDRILSNRNKLKAELALYDFGPEKIKNPVFHVEITQKSKGGDSIFYKEDLTEKSFCLSLEGISEASCLQVRVSVDGNGKTYTNKWQVYVYPEGEKTHIGGMKTISDEEELKKITEEGGKAIVDIRMFEKKMKGSYTPVFWSPVFFPQSRPCGAIIDASHPVFDNFPTGQYLDYQWKPLVDHAYALDISPFKKKVKPMMEFVPNFMDNTTNAVLFEAKIGKADLLFCGFDLDAEELSTRQLKESIAAYMLSENFHPVNEVELEAVLQTIKW